MIKLIFLLLFVIFIYLFILNKNKTILKTINIKTKSGHSYLLYEDELQNNKAEMLNIIETNMYILKDHLVKNIDSFPKYKKYIKLLETNFTKDRTKIFESDPTTDLTSYSINKGEEVAFCLKSKTRNYLYDINLLMYVAIHELSHIACPDLGHGIRFKKIFKKFIQEAIKIKIYIKKNYNIQPVEYCGMVLNSSII